MKVLYNRTFFLNMLLILFISRSVYFPYHYFEKTTLREGTPKVLFIKTAAHASSAIIRSSHFRFDHGLNSHINGTLVVFAAWKFILSTLLELKLPILDKRKRILTLITRYFEGSKYKDYFFFS
jgi:hypothetical protein